MAAFSAATTRDAQRAARPCRHHPHTPSGRQHGAHVSSRARFLKGSFVLTISNNNAGGAEFGDSVAAAKPRRRIGRWLLGFLLIGLLAIAAIVANWLHKAQRITSRIESHVASQPYPGFAIGDLGGMPVKIPRHMAEMLEYDGDPGWAPAPDWRPPVRTFESKINSFGFYVRYPDGQTLDSWERREEKRLTPPWEDRWIDVGVKSGKRYTRDGFLDVYVKRRLLNHVGKSVNHRYYRQPENEYGLEVYRLTPPPEGPDPTKTRVIEEFVGRDASGKVISTFDCTVSFDINRSTCSQVWSMEDHGLRVQLTASYRRPLLQHWGEIQPMVTRMVLRFRHYPSKPEEAPSAPR